MEKYRYKAGQEKFQYEETKIGYQVFNVIQKKYSFKKVAHNVGETDGPE